MELLEGQYITSPTLEGLCLDEVLTSHAWAQEQLRAVQLPRLRELYFTRLTAIRPPAVRDDERISLDFLRRLDIIQTDGQAIAAESELAQGQHPPVLLFARELGDPRPLSLNTTGHPNELRDALAAVVFLSALASRLELPPPSPPSITPPGRLILPPILRHYVDAKPVVAEYLRDVEALCAEKGVRIIWDEEVPEGEFISPAFRRHARELREARALEG